MNDKRTSSGRDEQPVAGAQDERNRPDGAREARTPEARGGPMAKDRAGYRTHFGETAYGGGQSRYAGQSPVPKSEAGGPPQGDKGRPEGRAGSKATLPGAGADKGPPDNE